MIAPGTDAGIVWFHGLGFRPAVLTPPHRADQVDPARLVPAPDADIAYSAKFDPYAHLAATPTLPGEPEPWTPCCIDTTPFEPLPPVAPVPVPASASLLIAAVAAFALLRRFG